MTESVIVTPNIVDTTLEQDNQPAGSITPGDVRESGDSLAGLPVSATISTSGSSAYTFLATDYGCLVLYNSTSAGTFTVPANVFQVYTVVGCRAINTGQLTIAQGSGFTIAVPSGLTLTPVQWATVFVHFTSATTGVLM